MKIAVFATLMLLTAVAPAVAAELPNAKPNDVGLSPDRLARIGQAINREIETNRMPGAVVLIARKGKIAYFETFGFRDKVAGAPMPKEQMVAILMAQTPGEIRTHYRGWFRNLVYQAVTD